MILYFIKDSRTDNIRGGPLYVSKDKHGVDELGNNIFSPLSYTALRNFTDRLNNRIHIHPNRSSITTGYPEVNDYYPVKLSKDPEVIGLFSKNSLLDKSYRLYRLGAPWS